MVKVGTWKQINKVKRFKRYERNKSEKTTPAIVLMSGRFGSHLVESCVNVSNVPKCSCRHIAIVNDRKTD